MLINQTCTLSNFYIVIPIAIINWKSCESITECCWQRILTKCCGIFNNHFVANCPRNALVTEFWNPLTFGEDVDNNSGTFLGGGHGVQLFACISRRVVIAVIIQKILIWFVFVCFMCSYQCRSYALCVFGPFVFAANLNYFTSFRQGCTENKLIFKRRLSSFSQHIFLIMNIKICLAIIIIVYSFNVKLTSATFNNTSTRYIINPKTCKQKHLIVCPKAKNNFNETYFQKLSLLTEQMGEFVVKNNKKTNKSSIVISLLANDRKLKESSSPIA